MGAATPVFSHAPGARAPNQLHLSRPTTDPSYTLPWRASRTLYHSSSAYAEVSQRTAVAWTRRATWRCESTHSEQHKALLLTQGGHRAGAQQVARFR